MMLFAYSALVSTTVFFWTPLCNALLFRFGAAKIMLHDVFALIDFCLVSKVINTFLVDDLLPINTDLSYSGFIKTYNPAVVSVSQEEHMVFFYTGHANSFFAPLYQNRIWGHIEVLIKYNSV